MDESRHLLEKERIENKRLNPLFKKKMDDFLDSKKHSERREALAKKAFKVGFFDDAKGEIVS
jgi:hypothetical protein